MLQACVKEGNETKKDKMMRRMSFEEREKGDEEKFSRIFGGHHLGRRPSFRGWEAEIHIGRTTQKQSLNQQHFHGFLRSAEAERECDLLVLLSIRISVCGCAREKESERRGFVVGGGNQGGR